MYINTIKGKLETNSIFHSNDKILNRPTVIGYEKEFRWSWLATQLNTFIVATDFEAEEITTSLIEEHLSASFNYAKENYTGWPRGLQSGLGVIGVLISENVTDEAIEYCRKLKSGKKWAGFSIPVVINSKENKVYAFEKNPIWGRIFFPHFKKLIDNLK